MRLLVGEPRPALSGCDLSLRAAQERECRGACHQQLEPPPGLAGLAGIVARGSGEQLCVKPLPVGRCAALGTALRGHRVHEGERPVNVLVLEQREEETHARGTQRRIGCEHRFIGDRGLLGPPERKQAVRLGMSDVRRNRLAVFSERGDRLDRRRPMPAIAQGNHAVAPQAQHEP